MRNIFFLFLVVFAFGNIRSQVSIMVNNTSLHRVMADGSFSEEKVIVDQKTYNDKNQLVIERQYDPGTGEQLYFTTFFYNDSGKLVSVEKYDMKKNPLFLKKTEYNENGDTLHQLIFNRKDSTLVKGEKKFIYKKGYLKKVNMVSGGKGKTVYYYQPAYGKSPVKMISKEPGKTVSAIYTYNDSTKLPVSALILITESSSKKTTSIQQNFNTKGNIREERFLINEGLQKTRKYGYAGETELEKIVEEDQNGRQTAYYSINYFFHKITTLHLKSYFEE